MSTQATARLWGQRRVGPQRFKRTRLLVIGCGDIGHRILNGLPSAVRVVAQVHRSETGVALWARGIQTLQGDMDNILNARRIAALARACAHVIYLIPPPTTSGKLDLRLRRLLIQVSCMSKRFYPALGQLRFPSCAKSLQIFTPRKTQLIVSQPKTRLSCRDLATSSPGRWVYVSTSGVYGDCGGALVTETRPLAPGSARAQRRVDAEQAVLALGAGYSANRNANDGARRWRTVRLRVPGIYAETRLPLARLHARLPALQAEDDIESNHIHADDLARACWLALWRGKTQRAYNLNDDSGLKLGAYFDQVADWAGLPRPPRLGTADCQAALSAGAWSFMSESRRLDTQRMKQELRLQLRYPSTAAALAAWLPPAVPVI